MKVHSIIFLATFACLIACAQAVIEQNSFETFSIANSKVRLDLQIDAGHLLVDQITAGGRTWLLAPSPLFEFAVAECVWNSQVGGTNGRSMSVSAVPDASGITIRATLLGCPSASPNVLLRLSQDGDEIRMDGSVSNPAGNSTTTGWFGPFSLGDLPRGSLPIFDAAAHVAAISSRRVYDYPYDPLLPPPEHNDVREEAFVIGFDGVIYGSAERNNGPWSIPQPLYDLSNPSNRNVFPSGAPLSAVRRNDFQTDVFAVAGAGPNAGRVMTVFRVGDNVWSAPISLWAEGPQFPGGTPLTALSLHEERDPHVNEIEVFLAGQDGFIYSLLEANDRGWNGPVAIAGNGPFDQCTLPRDRSVRIAGLARNDRQRDLFFIDASGRLCTMFMLRIQPSLGIREPWSPLIALSPPGLFDQGATPAAAHGAGNSEHVFAVGRVDHQVYWAHEDDDSAWSVPVSIDTVPASPTGSIMASRRTARDVVVAFVGLDGFVHTNRLEGDRWTASPDVIPQLGPSSPDMKIAMSLRDPNQLDLFGIAADGDNRLWTSGDGAGSVYFRAVFPKLVFSHASLGGAKGMVATEIGGSTSFPERAETGPCTPENRKCFLGMPYSPKIGVPEAMNIMEVVHLSKEHKSFFLADVSPPIESNASPAQFTAGTAGGIGGDTYHEVTGFWTTELRANANIRLPSIVFGGYGDGDWHHAMDVYKSRHPGDLKSVSTPKWLRNAGAIYSFSGGGAGGIYLSLPSPILDIRKKDEDPFKYYSDHHGVMNFDIPLSKMFDEAEGLGTNVIYLWDYWAMSGTCQKWFAWPYFCKGDYYTRQDLGGLHSLDWLKLGIKHVHERQGRVLLYIEPFIFGYGADIMNQFGDLYWARDPGGLPWFPFEHTAVPLSYAHSGWQDRVVQIVSRLIEQTDADGVVLDSGPWRLNERVETKGEIVRASPLEHSRAFFDLADRVRREIQKIRPDAVVMSETMSGPGIRHLDGALSADLSPNFPMDFVLGGRIYATPTRYSISNANIFGNGRSIFDLNQIYAAGHNLALAANWGDNFMSGSAEYVKLLVQTRRDHADALVEGAQTELATNSSNGELIARHYKGSMADVLTIINLSGTTASGTVVSSPVLQNGIYCDIISNTSHIVSGNQLTISVAPVDGSGKCVHDSGTRPVCGLRVLVQGSCSGR